MWPICCNNTFFNFRPWEIQQIVCQLVAYGRSKTIKNLKKTSLKVVAYERWSPTRGSIYSNLTWKLFVFWKVVAYEGGSTVFPRLYSPGCTLSIGRPLSYYTTAINQRLSIGKRVTFWRGILIESSAQCSHHSVSSVQHRTTWLRCQEVGFENEDLAQHFEITEIINVFTSFRRRSASPTRIVFVWLTRSV